jgi:hypothetical protein
MSVVCLKAYREARQITEILEPRGLTEEFCEKLSAVPDSAVNELKQILTPEKPKRARKPAKPREHIAGLDWCPRLKLWKGCNGKAWLNPETLESRSYGWWLVTRKIGNTLVFNDYRYSSTTSGHQSCIEWWLQHHGYSYVTIAARKGLQDLDSAVSGYEYEISELAKAMARPRSQARKNRERAARIKALKLKLALVEKLKRMELKSERGSA